MTIRNGVTIRGTSNSNSRGSSYARRERKTWMLLTFDVDLGPTFARCSFEGCDEILTFETITADRFPVPGCAGGTYARSNIRPACGPCNSNHGGPMRAADFQQGVVMKRIIASIALALSGLVVVGGIAFAAPGPEICHPVGGKGETGYGWNLISPSEASKHIDEATGKGKHKHDGRTDVYAVGGLCPGSPTPTTTTTTGSTPSTTTGSTTATTTSTSATSSTSTTSTATATSSAPTSSTTSSSPTTPRWMWRATSSSPTTPRWMWRATTSTTTAPRWMWRATTSHTAIPTESVSTSPDGELAHTGLDAKGWAAIGSLLLMAGLTCSVGLNRRGQH